MTAQEFITAVQNGGAVEVDSDIDFNSYDFSSPINFANNVVINGNGHSLVNIQQGNSSDIFRPNFLTINNLNIRNLNLPSASLFYTTDTSIFSRSINNSQISGVCQHLWAGTGSVSSQVLDAFTFNRCSINVGNFYYIRGALRECYVVLSGTKYRSGDTFYIGDSAVRTYFKGNLTFEGSASCLTTFEDCCINIDISGNISFPNGNEPISVINSSKATSLSTISTNIVPATDTEMHDAQALYNKGFNIYTH